MVKVKICGLTRARDVTASVKSGADYVGFVVGFPSTPRNNSLEKAGELMAYAHRVKKVVVAPAHDPSLLKKIVRELRPDAVQLHGPLTEREKPKILGEIPTIRSISAYDASTNFAATRVSNLYDAIHLDSSSPQGIGGTGLVHDWAISREIRQMVEPKHTFLAGGLNPTNVARAIRFVRPFAVDSSSGVESSPGIKDSRKVTLLIKRSHEVRLK